MNFLQHLECFFLGGKPTFIFTKAIGITAPVYYKQIPDSEDYSTKLKPVNQVKYYNVPELPLEFVEQIPKDEEDKKKLTLIKVKTILDKLLRIVPFKNQKLTQGQEKAIFEKYLRSSFEKAGIPAPSFDQTLFEPNCCIRNGILYSFLKQTGTNRFEIDFTHYHKYDFKQDVNPILKACLTLKDDKLVFESISRFDKNLNLVETVDADDSENFIRIRTDLYATAFFDLTAVQHLLGCHFLSAFNLNVAVRMLNNENPLKQFLWNFVFGTMNINSQIDTLIGKRVGSVIGLSPFTEASFYDFIRDSVSYDFSVVFEPKPTIPNELCADLRNIKLILKANIKTILAHSNKSYHQENKKMFAFIRSKVKALENKDDLELLTSMVYAVSAHHEVVGNNSLELRSQAALATYGIDKYEYIVASLLLVLTAIPIRKITAHDVESTILNKTAKNTYLNMVSELLDYETSMSYSDPRFVRIKPSNLEAAVQV